MLARLLPLLLLAVAALLAAPAAACAGRGGGADAAAAASAAAPWDRELVLHGRRRSLLSLQGRRCGAVHPGADVLQRVEFRVAALRAKEAAFAANGARQGGKVVAIPTYVYNVVVGDGEKGKVDEATLRAQVDELNKAYATAGARRGAARRGGALLAALLFGLCSRRAQQRRRATKER